MIVARDNKGRIAKGNNLLHGKSKDSIYYCWVAMRERCNSPNNPMYRLYGSRGIKVCDRWSSFLNFYTDMGDKPENTYTLDRIDNDGDYNPENCRWVSHWSQQQNKRNNTFRPGITIERNKYRADIRYKGKRYFLGRFIKLSDALEAREEAEKKLGLHSDNIITKSISAT